MIALRNFRLRDFLGIATLWFLAAVLHFWFAHELERLPGDYVAEISYAAKCRSHQTPTDAVEEYESILRRRDQTLNGGADHLGHPAMSIGSRRLEPRFSRYSNLYGDFLNVIDKAATSHVPGQRVN